MKTTNVSYFLGLHCKLNKSFHPVYYLKNYEKLMIQLDIEILSVNIINLPCQGLFVDDKF